MTRTAHEILEDIAALLHRLDELEAELYMTQYPDPATSDDNF